MTISEMHYDFKMKLNKVDSNQNRNLLVPEIDWVLNEAQELFIKMIAQPRQNHYLGFEKSQRSIDDIRMLVVSDREVNIDPNTKIAKLPEDPTDLEKYLFYLKADVLMEKTNGSCKGSKDMGRLYIRQHDDDFENSPFDNSNFEWRTVNGLFIDGGVKVFDDSTFTNKSLLLSYIRKPKYINNAKAFKGGNYQLPSGINVNPSVNQTVNCELSEHTHREIVDIAVLIVTGSIQIPDYQVKLSKLNFNELN